MQEPRIIFEDPDIFVVSKPAGMASQSGRGMQMDLLNWLKNFRARRGEPPEVYLVHRLDQPVSGVMAYAKTKAAAADLSRQLTDGRMKKIYEAEAAGSFAEKSGTLVDWLTEDGTANLCRVVPAGSKDAKRAELHYQVKAERNGISLLEITLLTGRRHQIRVQLAHAGHPVCGDLRYGTVPADELKLRAVRLELILHGQHKSFEDSGAVPWKV